MTGVRQRWPCDRSGLRGRDGGSAAIGVALGWTEPYWVPEPMLILVLYIITGKRDRIRGKAIGTASVSRPRYP